MIGLYSANSQAITAQPFSFGNALQFDGVDDFVTLDSTITFTSPFTIGFWIKPTVVDINFKGVMSQISTTNRDNIVYRSSDIIVAQNGGNGNLFTDIAPTQGVWQYYVFRWNTITSREGFKNAVKSAITSAVSANDYSIEQFGVYGTLYADMVLDEVSIWNTALTDAEITAIYNSGNFIDISQDSGDYVSSANLVNWWRFNESSGTTVTDVIGGNNGTLNNFTGTYWVAH